MTLKIYTPVIGRLVPKITVLTDLDEIIHYALQARREAHGNDELQAELNDILSQAYAEKWAGQ
jgi:hypothetical protein